jgi:hypothetical protein
MGHFVIKFSVKETLFSTSDIGNAKKCSIEEIIKNKHVYKMTIERMITKDLTC